MNEHWPRWIFASCTKHFYALRGGIPMYIEGEKKVIGSSASNFELRMDGPRFTEIAHNQFYVFVELNILVSCPRSDTNFHEIHKNVGIAAKAFTGIKLYKYGTAVVDDGTLFGCLNLKQKWRNDSLEINHFGQVGPAKDLLQASVEGHYQTTLEA